MESPFTVQPDLLTVGLDLLAFTKVCAYIYTINQYKHFNNNIMKTLITLFVLAVSTFTFGQETEGVTVTIVIENLNSTEGTVSAALYDEATFMRAAPLKSAEGKPTEKAITLILTNIKPGDYSIISLHDLNGNGRMDFEANGMPKEPYASSNNVVAMGPPNFSDSKFNVGTEDISLTIRM
ncbi:MAG: hypothetical protein ACI828_002118 [Flavobacteriales bacterium]